MIGSPENLSLLQAGGGPFATVRVIEYKGRKAVLKDYSRSRPIFRYTCGAFMTRREAAAYQQIHNIPGIPRLHGCVGRDGLLLEYIDGRNALQSPPSSFDPGFFLQLSEILSAIRARGVLHCDVVRNVCRTPDGLPFLVDFGASYRIPAWLAPVRSFLTRLRSSYDERAIAKLKKRVAPHLLDGEDMRVLAQRLPLERLVKASERCLRHLIQAISCSVVSSAPLPTRRKTNGLRWRFDSVAGICRLYCRTLKVRILLPNDQIVSPEQMHFGAVIFAHCERDNLALAAITTYAPFTVLVAPGRDGNWAAELLRRAGGVIVVRGSASRSGAIALRRLILLLQGGSGPCALSVDGPLGPAGQSKPGIFICARRTRRPVVPVGVAASPRLRFRKTWAHMFLPLPFSTVFVAVGEELSIDPGPASLDDLGHELDARLRTERRRAETALWISLNRSSS